jgi:hypothetical protein
MGTIQDDYRSGQFLNVLFTVMVVPTVTPNDISVQFNV